MCGICGIFDPHKSLSAKNIEDDISRMMQCFPYRGPDGQGTYIDPLVGVGLGHVRLSIIDLAGGQQPMSNPHENMRITFNGEIYNFKEERQGLEKLGVRFRTQSDTEVILALYERFGTEAFSRLRGQFAFALWDSKHRQLFLVRDRLGEKPLVYTQVGGVLYFSSELKALLRCSAVPRAFDRSVLGMYFLTQYVPAPSTLIQGVQKLTPGSYLRVSASGSAVQSYWRPQTGWTPTNASAVVNTFREKFDQAVRLCTVSDVPIGTYLSGGLDSTAVTAAVASARKDSFHSFAIFNQENHEQHPDWPYAQEAARHLKTQHHNVFYGIDELMGQIPELISRSDEPFEGPTMLVSYFLAKAAREKVKVVLTGNGGDELLGGYQSYYQQVQRHQSLWQWADRLIPAGIRRSLGKGKDFYSLLHRLGLSPQERRIVASLAYYREWFEWICPGQEEMTRQRLYQTLTAHAQIQFKDYFKQYLYDDLMIYHHRSITIMPDTTGMACSLEARNPFLDHELVEFIFRLPAPFLIHQAQNKYILAKAMEQRLPASILTRKKFGFSGMTAEQMNRWMRTSGRSLFRDDVLDSALVKNGHLPKSGFERLWTHYESISDPTAAVPFQIPIWSTGILALWYEKHIASL